MLHEAWMRLQENWEPKVAGVAMMFFIAFIWWDHRNLSE